MATKNRSIYGEKHHRSKLKEEDIINILKSEERVSDLALKYGVSWPTIDRIRKRKGWTRVNMP